MPNIKHESVISFFENSAKNYVIQSERKEILNNTAAKIAEEYLDREKINLNFICTHNSRQSQIAQVWSFFAIEYFKLKNIYTFSGGTSVTAIHRNTVKTLQQSGFDFSVVDFSHQNPKYLISFEKSKKSILGFSKTFDNANNEYPYIAITTCNEANKNCPFIPDAIHRFHLPYTDPKPADKTDSRLEKYLEINIQIANEIHFLFSKVKEFIES